MIVIDDLLLAAYLAGTGASMLGAQQQARKQKRIIGMAQADADKSQRTAIDTVMREAQQLAPEARQQALTAAEQEAYGRTMQDLTGAGGAMVDTAQGAGNISSDFAAARAQRSAAEGQRASDIAREMARVRAPGQVTTQEALRRGSIAEELGSLWNSTRNRTQAAQMDAQAVEKPGWAQLGELAALASGAALTAGAGAAPAAAGTEGVTGATGAFLGEGVASGVPAWDAASSGLATRLPAAASSPWWARPAMAAGMGLQRRNQPQQWAGR